MTLPGYVRLSALDDAIRPLVININRIPGIYTQTNCEGHVWHDCPMCPTKDGWMHFSKPIGQSNGLIMAIHEYCAKNPLFSLMNNDEHHKIWNHDQYMISGVFDAEHDQFERAEMFENMSPDERIEFFRRMDSIAPILHNGWRDLNKVVIEYIKKNISPTIFDMPYRNRADKTDFRIRCH